MNIIFDPQHIRVSYTISSVSHIDKESLLNLDYSWIDKLDYPSFVQSEKLKQKYIGERLYCIQIGTSSERLTNYNRTEDFSEWDNIVFVDVDFKQFSEGVYGTHRDDASFDFVSATEAIVNNMMIELRSDYYLYAWQLSKSGQGVHFLYYFDCEKSMRNFKLAAIISANRIQKAFKSYYPDLYEQIKEHDKDNPDHEVFDKCSKDPVHLLSVSPYQWHKSHLTEDPTFGTTGTSECNLLEHEYYNTYKHAFNNDQQVTNNYQITSIDKSSIYWDGCTDLPHKIKWGDDFNFKLATVLASAYGNDIDQAVQLFSQLANNTVLARQRRTRPREVIKIFKDKYRRALKGDILKNLDLVPMNVLNWCSEHLGIRFLSNDDDVLIRFHKTISSQQDDWIFEEFKPNYVFDMLENQYITDYAKKIDDIMKENDCHQIYVKAPCNTGKTTYIKHIFNTSPKAVIVCHLNALKENNYNRQMMSDYANGAMIKFETPTSRELMKMLNINALPNHLLLGWNQLEILLSQSVVDISDYQFLIDECHAFQTTVNYRYDVISSILNNIYKMKKVIAVSATPIYDHMVLLTNRNFKIEFKKQQKRIDEYISFSPSEGTSAAVYDVIGDYVDYIKIIDPNSVIAIYDNHNHTKYDKVFDESYDWVHLSRDDNSLQKKQMMSSQIMGHQILVSTAYALEGIEFLDEIKHIYVIFPSYFEITNVEVIQFCNRFRNAERLTCVKFSISNHYRDIQEEQLILAMLKKGVLANSEFREALSAVNCKHLLHITKKDLEECIDNKEYAFLMMMKARVMYIRQHTISQYFEKDFGVKSEKMFLVRYSQREHRKIDLNGLKSVLGCREYVSDYVSGCRDNRKIGEKLLRDGVIVGGYVGEKNDFSSIRENSFTVDDFFNARIEIPLNPIDMLSYEERCIVTECIHILKKIDKVLNEFGIDSNYENDFGNLAQTYQYNNMWEFIKGNTRKKNGEVNWDETLRFARLFNAENGMTEYLFTQKQKQRKYSDDKFIKRFVSNMGWHDLKDTEGSNIMEEFIKRINQFKNVKIWEVDWKKMNENGKQRYGRIGRGKGDRVNYKYCLLQNEDVKFKTLEEMYDNYLKIGGGKMNKKQFKNKWKTLNIYRKI